MTYEDVIPPGNYGAGPMIIWDSGPYCTSDGADYHEIVSAVLRGLKQGRLCIHLDGEKLRGAFTLLRMITLGKPKWLFIKEPDEFAADVDVTEQNCSVLTGRTIEELRRSRRWF